MRRARHSVTAPGAFLRAAWAQLRHIGQHKLMLFKRRLQAPMDAVYFYPGFPHPYTVVYRLFHSMGVAMRRGLPAEGTVGALTFLWYDGTYVRAQPRNAAPMVNGRCTDISKRRVEAVHQQVFGYGLAVNPLTHVGQMVCKSDDNGAHDGTVVMGPLTQARDDCVYQVLVDNRGPAHWAQDGQVCDLRVTVFDGKLSFVYLKFRGQGTRFSNTNSKVLIALLTDIFSVAELASLTRFCQEAGLDYGEMDVVRDHQDQRIYVLDLNKTPLGPPNGLSAQDRLRALDLYRSEFATWMKRHAHAH